MAAAGVSCCRMAIGHTSTGIGCRCVAAASPEYVKPASEIHSGERGLQER